jgi:hypothetical protein
MIFGKNKVIFNFRESIIVNKLFEMVMLDFYTYKVASAIYKTKHQFATELTSLLRLNQKSIYHRCVTLFLTFYVDSLSLYPTGRLIPKQFVFSKPDIRRYCNIYERSELSENEISLLEQTIYEFFIGQMNSNVHAPVLYTTFNKTSYANIDERCKIKLFNLSYYQVRVLKERYQGRPETMRKDVLTLIYIYSSLSMTNYHLSVPPSLLNRLQIDIELFGSPLNTQLNRYCSMFPEIENVFGSVGSYFQYEMVSNLNYSFNPPYIAEFMVKAVNRLKGQLKNITNYFIVGVLPAWSESSAFQMIKAIDTFRGYIMVKKANHKFFDYYSGEFLNICDSYIFIITDRTSFIPLSRVIELWNNSSN